MQSIPLEQVIKRFQSLPDALKDAVFSQTTGDAILKYAALRDIPEDKIYFIGALTSDVLLGYLRPESIAAEIQKETGIGSAKAAEIAHDIDTEIFSNVRLELKKLYPPTIQTPTVQSQGFSAQAPQAPAAAARPEPARPYVVPIPEKFRTKSAWPSQPIRTEPRPVSETPASTMQEAAPIQPAAVQEEKPKEASAPAAAPTPAVVPPPVQQQTPLSDIKPIVPLPTFIQSKFKETLRQTTGEKQTTQENPALKNAFAKYTTSHTAAKPAEEKPKESAYHEQITEAQTPKESVPASGQQKAEGKVIDLSGL